MFGQIEKIEHLQSIYLAPITIVKFNFIIIIIIVIIMISCMAITKGSRLFDEVKPSWTGLISGWVTI